jgi:superfamily I DNA/RNA helicase
MAEAEPVIRAVLPDANVPTSVRATGIAVRHAAKGDLRRVVERWLATNPDGIACVIGDPTFAARPRVRSLSPALAKGLEFDLVVLVDPIDPIDPDGPDPATSVEAAVDRYVAMTRATRELVILSGP